jgi:CRP-like cAMP-binding protein
MGRKQDHAVERLGPWEQLVQQHGTETAARGTVLYTPDQPAQDVLLLSSGQVALYLLSPERRALTLRVIEPGQLFGHVAMGGDGVYDTFAEALTRVQCYRVPHADIVSQIERDPTLGLALLEELGQHRLLVSRRLDEVAFKSVPARLASLLLDMAKSHDGPQSSRLPRRSHRQLAEMINAYRETVTKVINQFRAARLLEIDRSTITLVNLRRLEELAQG